MTSDVPSLLPGSSTSHSVRPGRVPPTPDNPAGYPPFDINKVLGFTNRQVRHYVKTNAVPTAQAAAFLEAVENRQKINNTIRNSGDTSDEEPNRESGTVHGRQDNPSLHSRSISTPVTRASLELTFLDDDETDSNYPTYNPERKGVKHDNKITKYTPNGGLTNYNLWENSLRSAFGSDSTRFLLESLASL
jgi:hypothetical protein